MDRRSDRRMKPIPEELILQRTGRVRTRYNGLLALGEYHLPVRVNRDRHFGARRRPFKISRNALKS